jgi:serine/threonine protein kinase
MASSGSHSGGTRSEADDLAQRVDRFRAAWQADQTTDLEAFLPAPPAPHRPLVLVEMIKADMELRAKAGLPVRVETYHGRFRHELPPGALVPLIASEYRLRHRHGDKPRLTEFRSRFPDQYDALSKSLDRGTAAPPTPTPADDDHPTPAKSDDRIIIPPSSGPGSSGDRATAEPDGTLPADLEYRLIRKIGAGAFGQVYEAEAPGGFRVAVKRIIRAVDHPASQGEIEALEAIKSLNHPFLLQTQAYWVFRDHLVIVMDLADGSLTDRINFHKKQGKPGVPPEELIPFFEQAAKALDYLHSQNVSHRDVKPQNLLTLKGYAKVADFGLARGHEHTMTTVGAEVGTPMYMAPEVWKQKVSLHSDQYSLAASYVQARLGRTMFPSMALHELFAKHLQATPDLDPLPEAEKRVLLKALAKRPDRRYPSCVAFAQALREAVLEPPGHRPLPSRWEVVSLVVAAALVCGLTLGVISLVAPRPQNGVPQDPPRKEVIWAPDDWKPGAEDDTEKVDGRPYYRRLTRPIAGEELVAILVPKKQPSDPPTFYMLENKITNRVFKAVWERAETNPSSALNQFRRNCDPETAKTLLPGAWRRGAIHRTADEEPLVTELGIEGDQAGVPVVRVTVPEAMLVAGELGGLLPTYDQWLKAVGAMGDGKGDGPAGPPEKNENEARERGLALGLREPRPASEPNPRDISFYGIHQLVSNGLEWTGETDEGRRLSLAQNPGTEYFVRLVGQGWESPVVLTYKRIRDKRKFDKWTETDQVMAGFRIVLEPPK